MQAYSYSKGQWAAIEDPLRGAKMKTYGFEADFTTWYDLGLCRLNVIARDTEPLSSLPEFPYDFCVYVSTGGVHHRIWIPTLPDFLQFARDHRPMTDDVTDLLRKAHAVLNSINEFGLGLANGRDAFAVKIEKEKE